MDELSNTAATSVEASSSQVMLEARHEHMFPKFAPEKIDRMRRFGEVRHYAANELLFRTGEIAPGIHHCWQGIH
jgi:thioredoxin reductase (NADPH)